VRDFNNSFAATAAALRVTQTRPGVMRGGGEVIHNHKKPDAAGRQTPGANTVMA